MEEMSGKVEKMKEFGWGDNKIRATEVFKRPPSVQDLTTLLTHLAVKEQVGSVVSPGEAVETNSETAVRTVLGQATKKRGGAFTINTPIPRKEVKEWGVVVDLPGLYQLPSGTSQYWPSTLPFSTNQTPATTFIDLHSDHSMDGLAASIGGVKLWVLFPATASNCAAYVNAHVSVHSGGGGNTSVLRACILQAHGRGRGVTEPGDAICVAAGWLHAIYTLEAGFLVGAEFLLPVPDHVEVLASALKDELQVASLLEDRSYSEEAAELLQALATRLLRKGSESGDTLVTYIRQLLEWEGRLKTAVKQVPAIATEMGKLEKWLVARSFEASGAG